MASLPAPVPLGSMITIKVYYAGYARKCKLPLRDMVPDVLESKILEFLGISHRRCRFMRFSDSAEAYVGLDHSDTSAWKQLYRAAKAKLKLKLCVYDIEKYTDDDTHEKCQPDSGAESFDLGRYYAQERREAEETLSPEECAIYEAERRHFEQQETETSPRAAKGEGDTPLAPREELKKPEQPEKPETSPQAACDGPAVPAVPLHSFTVCCNHCDLPIPDVHYHCSTCDDGDFDLCPDCVANGVSCHGSDHWLVKRSTKNGHFIYSVTERLAPKPRDPSESPKEKAPAEEPKAASPQARSPPPEPTTYLGSFLPPRSSPLLNPFQTIRTCNSCVTERPENEFIHCAVCDDFDLCMNCINIGLGGHHPAHGFVPATENTRVPHYVAAKMAPGRNASHNAICDGCDGFVKGVRHKCLDCPDWDYCTRCIVNAALTHPGHRFAPIYEPLGEVAVSWAANRAVHHGICCDGPLCKGNPHRRPSYIPGVRYKCAVCHDTDFCSACEASPLNTHNKTHPLIKLRAPIRHVTVTTLGEAPNRSSMPIMGDRPIRAPAAPKTSPDVAVEAPKAQATDEVVEEPPRHVARVGRVEEHIVAHAEYIEDIDRAVPIADVEHVEYFEVKDDKDQHSADKNEAKQDEHNTIQAHEDEGADGDEESVEESDEESVEESVEESDEESVEESDEESVEDVKLDGSETSDDRKSDDSEESAESEASDEGEPQNDAVEVKEAPQPTSKPVPGPSELCGATFVSDEVIDGTQFAPGQVFEQTWLLRNSGNVAWPAGCSVKFVGGDYMGILDSSRPQGIRALMESLESTKCPEGIAPGDIFPFTVRLRAPTREGRVTSFWRLSSPDILNFGDRLWCEIEVKQLVAAAEPEKKEQEQEPQPLVAEAPEPADGTTSEATQDSQVMVFPKLQAESPESSVVVETLAAPSGPVSEPEADDFEECEDVDSWDLSDDSFETDEEYDILDASDEEFVKKQAK